MRPASRGGAPRRRGRAGRGIVGALDVAILLSGASGALLGCGHADPTKPSVSAPCGEAATPGAPFGTRCGQLVDAEGRVVFLRGVNARVEGVFDVTFSDGRAPLEPIPAFGATDAADMRAFGFDALRLPVSWSGIEPTETGGFDEAYLDRVAQTIADAKSAGLVVLVDFHQDAFSKEIGEDGAPLWAIVPAPTSLLGGPLVDLDQRRLSKQVQDAFATFFGEGPDGARLRDRFAKMATHVAQRFAHEDAVFGFEGFNEPIAVDEGLARFDHTVYPEIRAAAPDKLYLFEPSATRNFLDSASIPAAPLGAMTGYAPHVYTAAFTSTDAQKAALTKDFLTPSNESARREADAWQAPLVITEWGFDPKAPNAAQYFTWESELQEQVMASSFFWVWKEASQGSWGCHDFDATTGAFSPREDVRKALARVRPARVGGWPLSFGFDRASGHFSMTFFADPAVSAPHEIDVAPALGAPTAVRCDGKGVTATTPRPGLYDVACGGRDGAHHVLEIDVAPAP